MSFKIRHETKWIIFLALISVVLLFLAIVLSVLKMSLWMLWTAIAAVTLSMILYFAEQAVGTSITVEENFVIVKRLFGKKIIAVSEINAVDIKNYERVRKRAGAAAYTEYRMRMTIVLSNGDNIVLTDNATKLDGTKGFVLGIRERAQDEDVELYRAYKIINTKINRI
ncbi:MAG: hypothetical protein IJK31_07135 [Ruminococcus sp.]|nr:hypothetical protein [Ruminococcus sp.]